jgi:hypothetical protein
MVDRRTAIIRTASTRGGLLFLGSGASYDRPLLVLAIDNDDIDDIPDFAYYTMTTTTASIAEDVHNDNNSKK